MSILNIRNYSPNFKAKYYEVSTSNFTKNEIRIQTDNEGYNGKKPYITTSVEPNKSNKMSANPKKLSYYEIPDSMKYRKINYRINYKDTNEIDDNNGQGYSINPRKLFEKAAILDKKLTKQPLITTLARGEAKGKLIYNNDFTALCQEAKKESCDVIGFTNDPNELCGYAIPKNMKGIIVTNSSYAGLSHLCTRLREKCNVAVSSYDKDFNKKLKSLTGEFISINNFDNENPKVIKISENEVVNKQNKINKKINIPQMRPVNKLLTSKEYEKDTVGPKAYNLKRLEDMVECGKLKGVIIPKSFAVPYKYIENLVEDNKYWQSELKDRFEKEYEKLNSKNEINFSELKVYLKILSQDDEGIEKQINEINNMAEQCKLSEKLMVRSAFNGEDIENYTAAGLYDSTSAWKKRIINGIYEVAASKWNKEAFYSRKEHLIPHDAIKPTVIVQDKIDADYTFTIYTQSYYDENTLLIEMHSKDSQYSESREPYIIKYDRKNDDLKLVSLERTGRHITFDEQLKPVEIENKQDRLVKKYKYYEPVLKNAVKNALAIEKEFEHPQDIEGGIKNGKLYFWQTRNIV